MLNKFLILLPISLVICDGARILGIIPTVSYSHQTFFQPIWRELSLRGHQVTVVTSDPINDPSLVNLTEIDLHFIYQLWEKDMADMIASCDTGLLKNLDIVLNTIITMIEQQLEHPKVQDLIHNETEHFDLVMVEYFVPTMVAFAERFKCPFIGLVSLDPPGYIYDLFGNPTHPILYPQVEFQFGETLTFPEKMLSTLLDTYLKLFGTPKFFAKQQIVVEKYFGKEYPHVWDLARNASMLFVNSDPIFHPVRPLLPSIVQIGGGTHRQTAKPLPEDLKTILDNSKNGFVYFSLGTNVRSKDLSINKRNLLLEVFSELPYTVLWKFELDDLPGKPENVIISKWFPQQDVFKHPNIKLFITQGGLQSMDEAIYDYVPMIGIPFFGDQPTNVKKMVSKGFGLAVDHHTMDKNSLKATILEVIENPKYRNTIKKLADLARDRPMDGLELAIWWTEYVLRNNGAEHLKSPTLTMPWYEYYLLDVIAAYLLILFVTLWLLYFLFKYLFVCICYVLNYLPILRKTKKD